MSDQVWTIDGLITDRDSQSTCQKSLSQYHFVCHRLHMDWPGIESRAYGERP